MFYTHCHVVDSFVGGDKNAPKKSPAGNACRGRAAVLGRPPLFGRSAPSSLRPAQHRKTSRLQIYRKNVAPTHVERFAAKDIPCAQVNLNNQSLPYPDAQFDLVTSSEVVEHVENYRALLREVFRVTASGGVVVVTTPNVLNVNSRVRYLVSGFANLFGPLPVRNDKLYSTGGHITPIPYFYLAHALLDAGFNKVELNIDKVQKTSVFWLALLAPFIFVGWHRFMTRERKKFKTITVENDPLVASHFSWPLLVGRTIVVSAVKAGANPAVNTDAAR